MPESIVFSAAAPARTGGKKSLTRF